MNAVLIGGEVTLYFAASDQVQAGTVQQVVAAVVNGANLAATGAPPAITLTAQRVESDEFTRFSSWHRGSCPGAWRRPPHFGAALTLVAAWRKRQVLRRLRLSPAPV